MRAAARTSALTRLRPGGYNFFRHFGMKRITIRNGIFALLLFEAAIISLVMIVSMTILSGTYTGLIYSETVEVLNLHAMIINTRISDMEKLSFEIFSDPDIQRNLLLHENAANDYQAYSATTGLYTQLFTRWAMDKRLLSIGFYFENGDRTETAKRRDEVGIPPETRAALIEDAYAANGKCVWAVNSAGNMTVVLSRLIRDTSGFGFRPLGVLIICIDARQLIAYPSVVPQDRKPEMFCIAGDKILSESTLNVRRGDVEGSLRNPFYYDIITYAGERYFVSIRYSESTGWYFAYMLATKKLLHTITNINLAYILSVLVVLIIVVAVGYRLAKSISFPIVRLAETMKVVAGGDYKIVERPEPGRIAISEVELLSEDFSRMVRKIDYLINEVYAEKLQSMEMKYKILQQQINPHFLYNTLDTINWKALESGNGDISAMVRSLSLMLRGSVKGPDAVTVQEDLRFAENYILIQKYRFEERLSFSASVQPEVLGCGIPRVTLQPIVENCIIHNLEKYSGTCEIRMYSSHTPEYMEIAVDDNGQGVDPRHMEMVLDGKADAADGSIGLHNINQRIKMLFGDRFGIRVENRTPVGTRVTVTLPFKEL
jgi:two-component system sensor histidine kinase YesM